MHTEVLTVDPRTPDPDVIRRAAAVLRDGGLVAFPTETVYGLGANALDPAAVARIFAAKGRPATNPVIVHVAGEDPTLQASCQQGKPEPRSPSPDEGGAGEGAFQEVLTVAAVWPGAAVKLAARFWPGPLTVVVPRRPDVPDEVTAGGPTVAVRCPAHAVARCLIREAGVPIAAPSANRSTELSPTRAEHVRKGLDGRIDLILDGGPCPGGIESTVVDVTGDGVRLLRPGLITVPMLEEVVGRLASRVCEHPGSVARSPGLMVKHYSPRTPVCLAGSAQEAAALVSEAARLGLKAGWIGIWPHTGGRVLPPNPEDYAAVLYSELHALDATGYDRIVIEMPPDTPEWAAVRDRLTRAAAQG